MQGAEGKLSLHRVIVQKSRLRDLKEHPKKVMTTKMCKPEKKKHLITLSFFITRSRNYIHNTWCRSSESNRKAC